MYKRILCIIPARGGSKRLPGKNIEPLAGKPLIAYSIEHALGSERVHKTVVSTDDDDIARISEKFGAEVIRRPADISADTATSEMELEHALSEVRAGGMDPDLIVFLQCTSPLRRADDIDRAVEKLEEERADSLLSATKNERFLWRMKDGSGTPINYDYRKRMRDQDHPEEYQENGSIYLFKPGLLLEGKNRLGGRIAIHRMDYWSSFQVDDPEDFDLLEWVMARSSHTLLGQALPKRVRLIVCDFDGVITDNRVTVSEDGKESVACSRSDGMGISMLRDAGIEVMVLSKERNPVVEARCRKLGIESIQAVDEKASVLRLISADKKVPLEEIVYVGNDINDAECLKLAGCGIVVSDAHRSVRPFASAILRSSGGSGALREICDALLAREKER